MKSTFSRILYGGDYNPNQWPREVWDEDMRIFRKAHINSATINVFSWAKLQPSQDKYDFSWLDDTMNMLEAEGYDIVLATSTAALPAWMFKKYPNVARVDYNGRLHKFGFRHNACPNSPEYRMFSVRLAEKLAQRYAGRVACWHVNNEYGGICYCDQCQKAFRVWLREKYGTIEKLNDAWNMEFWGHLVYDWDEIVAPNVLTEGMRDGMKTAFAGMSLDYNRFNSDSMLQNFKDERDAIRRWDTAPITTNLMGPYKPLDYFKWAKEMDVVSWDHYPAYDTPRRDGAFMNDLMRGLKDMPFMLMEQTPSQQNWQPFNSLKRPGQMRAQSYQTLAHGGDTIQFFQLRRSRGACEKFHGAVISHSGRDDTRVLREVEELGRDLEKLSPILPGAVTRSEVGILFDWETFWALEYASGPNIRLTYLDQIYSYYDYFYKKNISVDIVPFDGDLSRYKVVVAPVLYMVKEGMQQRLEKYVAQGGTLVTTYMSGIVDENDNVHLGGYPGPLSELAGVWVEEIDALAPDRFNRAVFSDGRSFPCGMVCDLMHTQGAQVLATYGEDFYAGTPAVTRNDFGKGKVYYIGSYMSCEGIAAVLDQAVCVAPVVPDGEGLEIAVRWTQSFGICFVINFTQEAIPLPASLVGKQDLLADKPLPADDVLDPFAVRVIRL